MTHLHFFKNRCHYLIRIYVVLFALSFCMPQNAYCSGVQIEKTVYMTVGSSTTINPWSVVKSQYSGFSCISTSSMEVSDKTAISVTKGSTTKTRYPTLYQTSGYSEGYYNTYKIEALKTGSYTVNTYVFCGKREGYMPTKYIVGDFFVLYHIIVTEAPKVTAISIPDNLTLKQGESYTFSPQIYEEGASTTLSWTSSNSSVVSVNNGKIQALSYGTSVITCTASNGVYAQCKVTIDPIYVSKIILNQTELEITPNERFQLKATISPDNASIKELKWSSSNEDVAFVGTDGTVIGIAEGYCNITVNAQDGSNVNASCLVHVINPVTVKAKDVVREYGDQNPLLEYSAEGGTLNGEPEIYCSATPTSPVGEYEITVKKGNITNSQVSLVHGKLTIVKAPLTVSVKSCTKTEGETNPTFEVEYTGFKNGENESVLTTLPSITTEATVFSKAGDYELVISGGQADNYDISYINGILHVLKAYTPIKDITNLAAGSLPAYIPEDEKMQITELTISGQLNGTDIKYIRDMIIMGKLTKLDIRNASIVSGGDAYYGEHTQTCYTRNNEIGQKMFMDCKNLSVIVLPSTVTKIKSDAFFNCHSLSRLDLPESCREMDNNAIHHCNNLQSILLGAVTNDFDPDNCASCPQLESIEVAEDNQNYTSYEGVLYSENMYQLIKYPAGKKDQTFIVPESVIEIKPHAFETCENLIGIEMPPSVSSIGAYAFSGCQYLNQFQFPETIKEISDYVLFDCQNLREVDIPCNIITIGTWAFSRCRSLTNINCQIDDILSIKTSSGESSEHLDAFEGISEHCTWHVKKGCKNNYLSQPWWISTWTITEDIATGFETVHIDMNSSDLKWVNGQLYIYPAQNGLIDIYNLNGILIKRINATAGKCERIRLSRGIYIINNKKISINQ